MDRTYSDAMVGTQLMADIPKKTKSRPQDLRSRRREDAMTSRMKIVRIVAWWIVLFALMGEFSTQPDNPTLPYIFLAWIIFGVWRVVHNHREAKKAAPFGRYDGT
jgi:hypothetical protein